MIHVPEKFQPRHPFPYPPDNLIEFERWYFENYDFQDTEREYLPIMWTAFYVKHKFGQHKPAMVDLQKFLNGLDRSKKLYTIVQYDGGLLHNVSHLDIKVFSMSGGRTDYPLPLISQAHTYEFNKTIIRNKFANFVGKETYWIRKTLIDNYAFDPSWYVSKYQHTLEGFCQWINRSIFTLCPRGFGPTSFRIQEALQYGSIPVYISDEWVIPHNIPFTDYGVLIDAADAHRVHDILMSIPSEEIKRKQEAIPDIYKKYFTYEGCKEIIQKSVANEKIYI
jgi:hypothetical protein